MPQRNGDQKYLHLYLPICSTDIVVIPTYDHATLKKKDIKRKLFSE